MTGVARCAGEPVSWLRLERFHLGEIHGPEREGIADHLAACEACAACLARIRDDDASALPPLTVARRLRRRVGSSFPMAALASVGALAAAVAIVLGVRGGRHGGLADPGDERVAGSRAKGDAVAFSLVRDDAERVAGIAGVYRDGDRFKALVTCPPGGRVAFDLVIYEGGVAAFPLEPARDLACGNDVPLPGAFRLTGSADETVCLVWREGAPVDRATLGGVLGLSRAEGRQGLCKRLTAAPGP